MTAKRKTAVLILIIFLLYNLGFIWGSSLTNKTESHDLGVEMLNFLPSFVKDLFPNLEQLVYIVQKLAHFTEFACLGGLSCGLLAAWGKVNLHPFFHVLAGGFFTAAINETIQIFTDRNALLLDVWLDFAGFTTGMTLVLLIIRALVQRFKPKKTYKEADNVIAFPTGRHPSNNLRSFKRF